MTMLRRGGGNDEERGSLELRELSSISNSHGSSNENDASAPLQQDVPPALGARTGSSNSAVLMDKIPLPTPPARVITRGSIVVQDSAMPASPRFAPLPDANRRQFARDSPLQQDRTLQVPNNGDGRPSSTYSMPLQRVETHGRDSVLEMDLADAAYEPTSAATMTAGAMSLASRGRRRRHHRKHHRTPSIASRQTKRTVRSRAGEAIKALRRRRGSSSSSSSSSSTTSSSGSSSSSSGIGWRFWRSSTASSVSDDSYIPPEPTFTLFTPRLTGSLNSTLPSEPELADLHRTTTSIPHPYTSKSSEKREHGQSAPGTPAAPEVFESTPSRTLTPCLDKLREFWQERDQQEGFAGDLGASHLRPEDERRDASSSSRHTPDPANAGKERKTRNAGPAWWLDVQCPSIADMRQLRRLIPLHPLTIEDILSQETREKIEVYDQLGYYFVTFRAMDETYFRYSEAPSASSSSTFSGESSSKPPSEQENIKRQSSPTEKSSSSGRSSTEKRSFTEHFKRDSMADKGQDGVDAHIEETTKPSNRRRGKVDIVEGPKEGVEGVGVGAVNVYMVVFGDGVISFHFEDIDNHVNRVRNRIQQYGIARNISSHWIAYGLMDSIVDTFFPLIDFIEQEADDIDAFLSNPLSYPRRTTEVNSDGAVNQSKNVSLAHLFKLSLPSIVKAGSLGQLFTNIKSATVSSQREAALSKFGKDTKPASLAPKTLSKTALGGVDDKLYDRGKMLKRIAVSRKLIQGLSRLLIPKTDVVRGLRKRIREEAKSIGHAEPGQRHDINIYLGDLQDHIVTMQQTLNFFDTMLSHDHPAYLGVLRLAYEAAKIGNDKAIVRLYIVTLTFLPLNIFTGMFSLNVVVPHNGVRNMNSVEPDGSPAPLNAFGGVIAGVIVIISTMMFIVYYIFKTSREAHERKGSGAKRL